MKCPHCDVDLMMTERQGIEIDYCSKCRGVWLDRGELDKIIERSAQDGHGHAQPRQQQPVQTYQRPEHHQNDGHRDYRGDKHYKHHKKKSWLGEVFDFD
ncbi:zf-TFIIB domain-containing protein [Fundidesulfovibrio soli]|uniref:TFIIB-type zinc ribbon-containing protein n=1 Tax=Fundidesulfovibrio soli TaxID=2922716 RepID=UPI001FAEA5CF|nr:zf-TFIIB domain-containing protein [Fundidesulfovibrio soli]